MFFKKIKILYTSRIHHPYMLFFKWGVFFFTFFLLFSLGGFILIKLQFDFLHHQLSIGYETLSSTSTALDAAKDNLNSLSCDFTKLNNDLQSTSEALQKVKEDLSPTCKDILTAEKDLYRKALDNILNKKK